MRIPRRAGLLTVALVSSAAVLVPSGSAMAATGGGISHATIFKTDTAGVTASVPSGDEMTNLGFDVNLAPQICTDTVDGGYVNNSYNIVDLLGDHTTGWDHSKYVDQMGIYATMGCTNGRVSKISVYAELNFKGATSSTPYSFRTAGLTVGSEIHLDVSRSGGKFTFTYADLSAPTAAERAPQTVSESCPGYGLCSAPSLTWGIQDYGGDPVDNPTHLVSSVNFTNVNAADSEGNISLKTPCWTVLLDQLWSWNEKTNTIGTIECAKPGAYNTSSHSIDIDPIGYGCGEL